MRALKIAIVLICFGIAPLANGQDEPDQVLAYKTVGDVELKLDLFLPADHKATDDRSCIVFFFGGGWVGGSTTQFQKQSRYLAERGMVAICAEYRIRSKHQTTPRECVKDGKSAIRWVRTKAEELGIDPERIAAAGGSAGGHVAASTATVKAVGFDEEGEDTSVSCVPNALVLFNPVYDNGPDGYGNDRVSDYWEEISPMHNLDDSTPPTIVYLGTEDKLIPVETAKEYQRRMKAAGVRSDLHLYEGAAHGFFNRGEPFEDTLNKTDEFLVSLGFLDPKE